ncbi:Hypothetical protein A7982_10830 [Minicystis rosea]|nr:Hypothetical protein A7982_10830 [Minicystis rosea]
MWRAAETSKGPWIMLGLLLHLDDGSSATTVEDVLERRS